MILGPQAVTLAAFPVNLIQETKKFAKTEELYLYLIQIDDSVPAFFFSNLDCMYPYKLNLRLIFYNLILATSTGTNDFSQSQDRSQLGLDEYNEINFFHYSDPVFTGLLVILMVKFISEKLKTF